MAATETEGSKGSLKQKIIAAVAILVVVLVAMGVWAYAKGIIYPMNAAAKYGAFDYLDESEVTEYIMTYKQQMGYGEADDDEWAEFLAMYNLTPDRLRFSTITQILSDKTVKKRCDEMGIQATDAEVDAAVQQLKSVYGIGGEETWSATLALYGQTEEGLEDAYRLQILKEKLCDAKVPTPTPTDDEVRDYISDFAAARLSDEMAEAVSAEAAAQVAKTSEGSLLSHSYCFAIKVSGDEAHLTDYNQVDLVRQEFMEMGTDEESFVTVLALYSNDEELIEGNGAMGWNVDGAGFSETYERMLATVAEGGVSSVFTDGDRVCFIWVDQTYTVPYAQDELDSLDLDAMPKSLREYFTDCTAYGLWKQKSQEYLADLVANMDVTVYPMPADVPYNVDMSPYLVEEDASDE